MKISPMVTNRFCAAERLFCFRFGFRKHLNYLLIAATLMCCGTFALAESAANDGAVSKRPNIVLILTDDMGYETIGAYGGTQYATPNIDALASTGIKFNHCYAQPICTPSRVKIMTGRSNIRNYIDFNILDPSETTFGHILQDAGYKTAIAGKWQLYGSDHRRNPGTGMHPSRAGFDQHLLWQVETLVGPNQPSFFKRDNRYWGPYLNRNGTVEGYPDGSIEYAPNQYSEDLFTDFLCNFITENKEHPFLVYYAMQVPHSPFHRTPDSADLTDQNRYLSEKNNFGDMVQYIDKLVGKIVAHLEEEGLRDNTLIIFTGDNGTDTGITSRTGTGKVRGGKGRLTNAGTHVPLIVNWFGGTPKTHRGKSLDDLIDFSDFVPTLAEAAGADLPEQMIVRGRKVPAVYDGKSFLPQVTGQAGEPREWVYVYYNREGGGLEGGADGQWARTQRYKLYGKGGVEQSNNFYDVLNDPAESRPLDIQNLSPQAHQALTLLQNAIRHMQVSTEDPAKDQR